ncbi:PP2C family protein-serine/threonine phosphatase [Pseudonocardia sp. HH130630-07]|uniref:PP2C family protein-serine/threonine phosphatase n=1 Tax=Pseudonocardia sp. HH130630-07 TaxID=1690815 RepID=UPI00081518EE|nr:PP2C family protein-serine/threonine phosphatase [Pseudonocardia sp. HH130630-07]ANY08203.1 hypothetical protein AFB00_20135 [Pseudonocardia sp. HH130630-07]
MTRLRGILHYPDQAAFDRSHPGPGGDDVRARELGSVVVAALPAPGRIIGAILLGWSRPHAVEPTDLLYIATIAGYAGQAMGRARRLTHRTTVAHEMQNAMLTELPRTGELAMAARYLPADSRENVGGDWYDAAALTDPDRPHDHTMMLSIGDIIGHSLTAVTLMGQVRSMLRQAAVDHPGGPPSRIVEAFETANEQFDLGAAGTAVVAHLRRSPSSDWSMTWTNAGHPPPILLHPGRSPRLLDAHDLLFGFKLSRRGQRTDHHLTLQGGSTVFFYTDGLVERRDSDLDAGTQRLIDTLAPLSDQTPQQIVDTVIAQLVTTAPDDDVVAFAVRIPD